MSDYTSTYTESTGDTIDTTDFSTEFNAIETAVATKVDKIASAKQVVILDNPEVLLTISNIAHLGTSGVWTSSSGFASTTLPTAGATAAILRVFYRLSWSSDADVWSYASVRKAGESDISSTTAIAGQRGTHASAAGTNQVYVIGEGIAPLDGSSDFEYTFSFESSANLAEGGGIYLVGYYV